MKIFNELSLSLEENSYPIIIGVDLLANVASLISNAYSKYLIVSDSDVAPLYLDQVKNSFKKSNLNVDQLILQAGEKEKNWHTLNKIFNKLLETHYARDACLIALGGGVIGDMVGFAAACYMRGIDFIQVPTTLLAQVDSSVGGKTAINHPLGKNMIGAFKQPKKVLIDINTLNTLDGQQFSAGMAEVIKYGLIGDAQFITWLEEHADKIKQKDQQALCYAISTSCQAKADIVAIDEKEQGKRALLNLGHTFGHAIEAHYQYKGMTHGEAVALGIVVAANISKQKSWLSEAEVKRIIALLNGYGLRCKLNEVISCNTLLKHMAHDKKVAQQQIRLILMQSFGLSVICDNIDNKTIVTGLNAIMP